jgi:hypothetical protein
MTHEIKNDGVADCLSKISSVLAEASLKNQPFHNFIKMLRIQYRDLLKAQNCLNESDKLPKQCEVYNQRVVLKLKKCGLNKEAEAIENLLSQINLDELSEKEYGRIFDFIPALEKNELERAIQNLENEISTISEELYPFCSFSPILQALKEDQETDKKIKIKIAQHLTWSARYIKQREITRFDQITASEKQLKDELIGKRFISDKLRKALYIFFPLFIIAGVISKIICSFFLPGIFVMVPIVMCYRHHLFNKREAEYTKLFVSKDGRMTRLGTSLHSFFHQPSRANSPFHGRREVSATSLSVSWR